MSSLDPVCGDDREFARTGDFVSRGVKIGLLARRGRGFRATGQSRTRRLPAGDELQPRNGIFSHRRPTAAVQPMVARGDIATPFRNIGIEPISLLT